jgi:hypothetical protein
MARESRQERLGEADATVITARAAEDDAREHYHDVEAAARRKLRDGDR